MSKKTKTIEIPLTAIEIEEKRIEHFQTFLRIEELEDELKEYNSKIKNIIKGLKQILFSLTVSLKLGTRSVVVEIPDHTQEEEELEESA
jgi:hypothetical protein